MPNPKSRYLDSQSLPPERSNQNSASRLSPTTYIKGELKGDEDLIIQGEFQGKIYLENSDITIEPGAKIKAEIRVKNILVRGSVEGNIHATGKVFIEKDGQMTGDISASRISIAEGAQFKGSVKMLSTIK